MGNLVKFAENSLFSIGMLAALLIGLYFLLNLAAKKFPAPVSDAASTIAGYTTGSAYGF